jgi:ribosome-associated protein
MSKKPIESAQDAETTAHVETESELEKLLIAARGAAARKAIEMVALDIRRIASFADFFLICSGTSSRQIQAIVDEVRERLRAERGSRPLHIEGYETGEWILMDYGDLIVHVFAEESRKFYQLERLWRDAERVELPADL